MKSGQLKQSLVPAFPKTPSLEVQIVGFDDSGSATAAAAAARQTCNFNVRERRLERIVRITLVGLCSDVSLAVFMVLDMVFHEIERPTEVTNDIVQCGYAKIGDSEA